MSYSDWNRHPDGPEDPEQPEAREYCMACDEDLPRGWADAGDPDVEPEVYHRKMADTEFRDVDTDEVTVRRAPVAATEEESEWTEVDGPYWECPKCGGKLDVDEAFWIY